MVCLGVCVDVATAICQLLLASFLLTFEMPLFRDLTRVRCCCFHVPSLALLEPLSMA